MIEILKKYWGYSEFRPTQKKVIDSVLSGNDTLCIMPTGGGKSICFQVPALKKDGICIVVSPLIALMQDQVLSLKKRGVKAVALCGYIPEAELHRILDNCIFGGYKFLYLSPERLSNFIVSEKLQQMPVNLIAIDEAHCISHWGKDFRPAYLECYKLREWFENVPIIALTASATKNVQEDILLNLKIKNTANIITNSLKRDNIAYMVYNRSNKKDLLYRILKKNKGSSIVYVSNRGMTLSLSEELNAMGISSCYYHGGLPQDKKKQNMQLWLYNDCQVVVATNAFGMGIDKPDVRTVIHWQLPSSLEDYYQEAGRAGRDEKKAFAVVLISPSDVDNLIKVNDLNKIDINDLKQIYKGLCNYFNIAVGDIGNGEINFLDVVDFASKYKFNVHKILKVLEFLDTNSIISLNRNYNDRTLIKIKISSNEVIKYIKNNPNDRLMFLYLLRTYSNIYEREVDIKISSMASVFSVSSYEVTTFLKKLNDLNIIEYQNKKTDLEIIFLTPRDNDRTINPIAKNLIDYNNHKEYQLKSILEYIDCKDMCKQNYILKYFGQEAGDNCGICDYCLEQKHKNNNIYDIENRLLFDLKTNKLSLLDIEQKYSLLRGQAVEIVEKLLENKLIKRNISNKYELLDDK